MFSDFEDQKTTYFDNFFLNFSIETKIKTLFLISYLKFIKKMKWYFRYTDGKPHDCQYPFINLYGELQWLRGANHIILSKSKSKHNQN